MTIVRRVTHFPALDKVSEYRELLEKRVSDVTARGFTPYLMSRIHTDEGPELVFLISFDDMDAEAQFRTEDRDPGLREQATAINRRGQATSLFTPIVQANPGRWDNTRYFLATTGCACSWAISAFNNSLVCTDSCIASRRLPVLSLTTSMA